MSKKPLVEIRDYDEEYPVQINAFGSQHGVSTDFAEQLCQELQQVITCFEYPWQGDRQKCVVSSDTPPEKPHPHLYPVNEKGEIWGERTITSALLVYKQWKKIVKVWESGEQVSKRYLCDGWFVFGFIPVYIRHKDVDLPYLGQ